MQNVFIRHKTFPCAQMKHLKLVFYKDYLTGIAQLNVFFYCIVSAFLCEYVFGRKTMIAKKNLSS